MAVPKKRTSKQRKRLRRANDGLKTPTLSRCSRCEAAVMPHRICGNCGYYKGRLWDQSKAD